MAEQIGRSVSVSLGRRIVDAFLHASMTVPTVAVQKQMNVAELVSARQKARVRPSWMAIFTKAYARTAVVIVSDGYDAGDTVLLDTALSEIKRRCHSLVWLNPLADRPGFSPASAGMQAALPHLDLFAGARDLASLERIFPQILGALQ